MKDWLAQQLNQQLQINPTVALVIVAGVSVTFGFLGRLLWAALVRWWELRRYGGWKVVVSGGNSGRSWHAPLDTDLIRQLLKPNYFAFKRDLGTVISGEGNLDFSFGVPVTEPVGNRPPTAPGLTIDPATKTITIDFAKARAARVGA